MSKFVYDEKDAKGLKLFDSEEAAIDAAKAETLETAKEFGFDTVEEEPESYLCGKAGTGELVEVFLDGTWEHRDVSTDEHTQEGGTDALGLRLFLDNLKPKAEQKTADRKRQIHVYIDKK